MITLRSIFSGLFRARKFRGLSEEIGEGPIDRVVENIAPGTYSMLPGGRLVQFTADGVWVEVPCIPKEERLDGWKKGDEVFVNGAESRDLLAAFTVLEIIEMPLPFRYRELQGEFARMAEILISLGKMLCRKDETAGNQCAQKCAKGSVKRNVVHRNSSAKSDVWQLHLTRRGQRRARFASARIGRRHER